MYQDLRVWHKSIELVKEIYLLTEKLPSKEKYILSDQMAGQQFQYHLM